MYWLQFWDTVWSAVAGNRRPPAAVDDFVVLNVKRAEFLHEGFVSDLHVLAVLFGSVVGVEFIVMATIDKKIEGRVGHGTGCALDAPFFGKGRHDPLLDGQYGFDAHEIPHPSLGFADTAVFHEILQGGGRDEHQGGSNDDGQQRFDIFDGKPPAQELNNLDRRKLGAGRYAFGIDDVDIQPGDKILGDVAVFDQFGHLGRKVDIDDLPVALILDGSVFIQDFLGRGRRGAEIPGPPDAVVKIILFQEYPR